MKRQDYRKNCRINRLEEFCSRDAEFHDASICFHQAEFESVRMLSDYLRKHYPGCKLQGKIIGVSGEEGCPQREYDVRV